nr:putative thoc5 family protein [Quercus suber]
MIPVEDFLAQHPEQAELSEHDLTIVRIQNEHSARQVLEEQRQALLKKKEGLAKEALAKKEELGKLDAEMEKWINGQIAVREVFEAHFKNVEGGDENTCEQSTARCATPSQALYDVSCNTTACQSYTLERASTMDRNLHSSTSVTSSHPRLDKRSSPAISDRTPITRQRILEQLADTLCHQKLRGGVCERGLTLLRAVVESRDVRSMERLAVLRCRKMDFRDMASVTDLFPAPGNSLKVDTRTSNYGIDMNMAKLEEQLSFRHLAPSIQADASDPIIDFALTDGLAGAYVDGPRKVNTFYPLRPPNGQCCCISCMMHTPEATERGSRLWPD